MTVEKTEIVTTVAYMIGIRKEALYQQYGESSGGLLESLCNNKEATIIRYLNKLKTNLLRKFKDTDNEIRFNLMNLDRLEWFDVENIRQLEEWGVQVIKANYRAEKYMEDITGLLNKHIDNCKYLFYDWIEYDYIKELFYIPQYQKRNVLKAEFEKYMANLNSYPFRMYINWKPIDKGNILFNDGKFMDVLYRQHGRYFTDKSKVRDAGEDTKADIYDFINEGHKIDIVVDCENSDVFKLYGLLKNCNQDTLSKISKILLYDDPHTSTAWEWLSKFTRIPVEHIEVERVTETKSLVDIRMTAGVCGEYYKELVDSFILCSSDSDFWGLISSLPQANFLVLYENTKCGNDIKEAMEEHNIIHCCMDDFYTGNATELKRTVLFDKLEQYLPDLYGMNGLELARRIYDDTRITYRNGEIEEFYNKYIKTLRLKMDENGDFFIEILK